MRKLLISLCWAPLVVFAAMATGCSSIYRLIIHNQTGATATVDAKVVMPAGSYSDEKSVSLAPGASADGPSWFYNAPKAIVVEVRTGPSVRKVTLGPDSFPAHTMGGSSAGCPIHLYISSTGLRLSGPTAADRFAMNVPLFVGFGICCLGPLAVIGLVVFLSSRAKASKRSAAQSFD